MPSTSPSPRAAELRYRLEHFGRRGVPKYVALRDAVAASVTAGDWSSGARLPTESEWAAQLPLSLGTIQRALRMLAEEGVIRRRQGQGTFVAERSAERMHAPMHSRFVNDSGLGFLPVYPRIVARFETDEEGPWSRHLHASRVLCIDRLLRIGDEFKVFSRFYVDPTGLPAFAQLPIRKLSRENFNEIIWRETHQLIGRFSRFLTTITLPSVICKALGVKRGTRGQLLQISAFGGRGAPVYYQELYIPPNRRRLHLAADGNDPGMVPKSEAS